MQIARLRLVTQHIERPLLDDPVAVVRHMGAVQAQDYLAALWAVGLRARRATEARVEGAIARGEIIRSWPMRRTLHFVAAADIRWMLQLLAPRMIAAGASRYRYLGLDDAVFARAARVAERALRGGRQLQRPALYALWNQAGMATGGTRGLHLLAHLAQTGLICFGPRDGKQPTFALLDEWAPAARTLERDAALGELARRYFTSHGPATVHDFAWWSGLTVADARAGIELAKAHLVRDEAGGRTYWLAASGATNGGAARPAAARGLRPSAARGTAYLLPAWDEYTVAYRDRSAILDPANARRVNAGGGVLAPVIVVGARVVGTWRRTLAKGEVVVTPAPFGRFDRETSRAVAAAAQRYGRFLGLDGNLQAPRLRAASNVRGR